jgi:predicted DNA-binding transcriptional regulator AlpA
LIRATPVRAILLSIAFFFTLAPYRGFAEDGNQLPTKATKELPPQLLSLLPQKNMPSRSPILIRIFKEESELEVWKQDTSGRFEFLKVYPICRWSGDLGPKITEGDKGIKYSRSQRARLMRAGKFPKSVKGVAKANAWVESEIDALIAARMRSGFSRRTRREQCLSEKLRAPHRHLPITRPETLIRLPAQSVSKLRDQRLLRNALAEQPLV